ncbi:hypothetical protein ICL29_004025 [Salmonella enterica]|nr:hypothetical protein [Salmonella enterica]EHK5999302.1 hypothetical protein [Salmonella enterica]EIF5124640.1 hypothetical protein [Salmonella enterica]EIF5348697.1 hypothetical protein [Salmonella enterica]EIF5657294.1 hypothetical protein [Salmonella enterica]
MKQSWFRNRLTSAKKESVLYSSLAEIIQSLVGSFVEPWLSRITNRKSIFSMDEVDLATRTDELGQFFTIRTENSSSVPMLLQQRLDEIHFKGTDRPINQTIYREFDGINVTWEPLYAPVDLEKHPYGTVLITESTLESTGGIYGEMFLTSRGMISVSINELTEKLTGNGEAESDSTDQATITEAVLTKFNQFVRPLLPLHIVFDGLSLYISVYADEAPETFTLISISDTDKGYAWRENADEVVSFNTITVNAPVVATPGGEKDFTSITFDREKADGVILDYNEKGLFDDRIDVWSEHAESRDSAVLYGVASGGVFIPLPEVQDLLEGWQFVQFIVTPAGGVIVPGWDSPTALFDDSKADALLLDSETGKQDQ